MVSPEVLSSTCLPSLDDRSRTTRGKREKTKEIGIIKVLGCRIDNSAGLFLTEAAYIGLFGGALGMGLSFGISALLNVFLASSGMRSIIPAYLVFGAVGFSIVVALAAGMYPAVRAMKLSPLAAIRNE